MPSQTGKNWQVGWYYIPIPPFANTSQPTNIIHVQRYYRHKHVILWLVELDMQHVEKYQLGCTKQTNGITSALRCITWSVWQQTTRYRVGNAASLVIVEPWKCSSSSQLNLLPKVSQSVVCLKNWWWLREEGCHPCLYWMAYATYRSTNSNRQEVVQNLVTRSIRRAQQAALTGYRKLSRKWVRT